MHHCAELYTAATYSFTRYTALTHTHTHYYYHTLLFTLTPSFPSPPPIPPLAPHPPTTQVFRGLRKLVELHLQDNIIASLDKLPGLTTLPALTHLNVSGNRLTSLDALGGLTALVHLQAANNDLRALPSSTFADCARLRDLDLSGNKLTSVHCTKRLPSLRTLRLARNRIEDLGMLLHISVYIQSIFSAKVSLN